jgi:N-acetylmuramoyl-L-alanine amidase
LVVLALEILLNEFFPTPFSVTKPARVIPGNFVNVVLDPGHGGLDEGASGNGLAEKNLTLDIAQRIATRLRRLGLNVLLTRTADQSVALADRVALSNAVSDAIFVSLHVNYSEASTGHGIEIYRAGSKALPQPIRVAFSDSEESLDQAEDQLVDALGRSLEGNTAVSFRGGRQANFFVLRGLAYPAVLIECGFLSNREDAIHLGNPVDRDQLAQRIASGIVAYRGFASQKTLKVVTTPATGTVGGITR